MKKTWAVLFLFLSVTIYAVFGDDYDNTITWKHPLMPPPPTFDGMTFFNTETFNLLKFLAEDSSYTGKGSFYISWVIETDSLMNSLIAVHVPSRWDRVMYSGFASVGFGSVNFFSGDNSSSFTDIDVTQVFVFAGGGLTYKSDSLYIGAYAGVKVDGSEVVKTTDTIPEEPLSDIASSGLSYTIIPIYYPSYLSFVKSIAALLSMNVFDPSGGAFQFTLNDFSVYGRALELSFHYSYEKYDPVIANNLYGLTAKYQLIPQEDTLELFFGGGYRQFVNPKYDLGSFYTDTPYLTMGLKFTFFDGDGCLWTNVSVDLNKANPNFRWDISFGMANFLGLRLAFSPKHFGINGNVLLDIDT